jgi:ADP-heptose:LPS heptosyltransferase
MFGTLLNDFKGHCTELIVEADERLLPLYQRAMPEGITFVARHAVVPEQAYDSHISMASLCQYLRNEEAQFVQARKAYLRPDPQRSQRIRSELALEPGRMICGISWHSQNTEIGAAKSIQLKELIRHLDLPDCQWVNLQYGDMSEQMAQVKTDLGVDIVQCRSVDNRKDIDGLASLIDACDVVISISNTTVHLAGALGKKVHVMLPFCADWRWQHLRSDSIWYPHVQLHRQPTPGDWNSVFAQVRATLITQPESLS